MITFQDFVKKLSGKEYGSIAGARRGIGKSSWNDAEKAKAHKLANSHFGTEDKPAVVKKKAVKKERKAAPVVAKQKAVRTARAAKVATSKVSDREAGELLAKLHLVTERVGTVATAVDALEKARAAGVDVKKGMEMARDVLSSSINDLKSAADKNNGALDPEVSRKFAESKPGSFQADAEV